MSVSSKKRVHANKRNAENVRGTMSEEVRREEIHCFIGLQLVVIVFITEVVE